MAASIFISHSAKDAAAKTYLDAIADHLLDAKYDVWLDRLRLEPGDDWRVVIANRMAECHGAIALFSSTALQSDYFKFEVSNLLARWMRERDDATLPAARKFRFCPLVVPPLTVEELKKDPFISATYFGAVNWSAPPAGDYGLTGLTDAFHGLDAWPSPLETLEALVATILDGVKNEQLYLAAAAAARFTQKDMGAPAHYSRRLAQLYMRCPLVDLYASLRVLEPVLADGVTRLADLLTPAWVGFESGVRFDSYLCLSQRPVPADRFAIIGGSELPEFTSLMYLCRARRMTSASAGHVVVVQAPDVAGLSEASFQRDARFELGSFLRGHFSKRRSADSAKKLKALGDAIDANDSTAIAAALPGFVASLVQGGSAVILATHAAPVDFEIIKKVSALPEFAQVTFVATSLDPAPAPHDKWVVPPYLAKDYVQGNYDAYSGFVNNF